MCERNMDNKTVVDNKMSVDNKVALLAYAYGKSSNTSKKLMDINLFKKLDDMVDSKVIDDLFKIIEESKVKRIVLTGEQLEQLLKAIQNLKVRKAKRDKIVRIIYHLTTSWNIFILDENSLGDFFAAIEDEKMNIELSEFYPYYSEGDPDADVSFYCECIIRSIMNKRQLQYVLNNIKPYNAEKMLSECQEDIEYRLERADEYGTKDILEEYIKLHS